MFIVLNVIVRFLLCCNCRIIIFRLHLSFLICGCLNGGFFCCVKCVAGCMLGFPHMWKPCLNTTYIKSASVFVFRPVNLSFSAYCHQVRLPACLWKTSQVRERLGSCMLAVGTTTHAKSQHAAETVNKYLWTLHPKKVVWKNVHKRKCFWFFFWLGLECMTWPLSSFAFFHIL